MEQKKKGNRGMLFNVITFIVAFGLAFFVTTKLMSGNGIHTKVKKEIEALNKTCPREIDPYTRMDSVTVSKPKNINYYYTLLNVNDTIDFISLKKAMQLKAQQGYNGDNATKVFRDNGYVLKYFYNNQERKKLFDFTTTPNAPVK